MRPIEFKMLEGAHPAIKSTYGGQMDSDDALSAVAFKIENLLRTKLTNELDVFTELLDVTGEAFSGSVTRSIGSTELKVEVTLAFKASVPLKARIGVMDWLLAPVPSRMRNLMTDSEECVRSVRTFIAEMKITA